MGKPRRPKQSQGKPTLGSKALTDGQLMAFALGGWVPITSSNVHEAMYDEKKQELHIGFDGGDPSRGVDYYVYYGVPYSMAMNFASAGSKGVWVDQNLKKTGWPYAPTQKNRVTQGAQMRKAREQIARLEQQMDWD